MSKLHINPIRIRRHVAVTESDALASAFEQKFIFRLRGPGSSLQNFYMEMPILEMHLHLAGHAAMVSA